MTVLVHFYPFDEIFARPWFSCTERSDSTKRDGDPARAIRRDRRDSEHLMRAVVDGKRSPESVTPKMPDLGPLKSYEYLR